MIGLVGKVGGGLFAVLTVLAITLGVSACWWGWLLMVVLGAVHGHVASVPNWSFGTCWLFGLPMSVVLG